MCPSASIIAVSIIPYQEKLGNYNQQNIKPVMKRIIPYQEKLGNYNLERLKNSLEFIIPYQEKLGNYNGCGYPA